MPDASRRPGLRGMLSVAGMRGGRPPESSTGGPGQLPGYAALFQAMISAQERAAGGDLSRSYVCGSIRREMEKAVTLVML